MWEKTRIFIIKRSMFSLKEIVFTSLRGMAVTKNSYESKERIIFEDHWTLFLILTMRRVWLRLDAKHTGSLLKFQRSTLSMLNGVVTGVMKSITGTHAKCIGLGHFTNDFCWSCRDKEERETKPHLLITPQALCLRKTKDT